MVDTNCGVKSTTIDMSAEENISWSTMPDLRMERIFSLFV